jgi:hypothetical protein
LRACRNHDIGSSQAERCHHRADLIAHVIGYSGNRPRICRDISPNANNTNTIDHFNLSKDPVFIALENNAIWTVRSAGDHCHVMSQFDPSTAVFVGSRRRSVNFWREVVAIKEYFQSEQPSSIKELPLGFDLETRMN